MYQVQDSVALLRARRGFAAARKTGRPFVARTVLLLGLTSLLTDISSEMVSAVLPLYFVQVLGLNPLAFGVLNGIQQGGSAFARLIFGFVADRMTRYREVAGLGYGLSAICKLGLLATTAFGGLAAVLMIDRIGKGIRTAPRDAMISLSSPQDELGTAFGVHRAMDTCGAMLGPLLGFALLALTPRRVPRHLPRLVLLRADRRRGPAARRRSGARPRARQGRPGRGRGRHGRRGSARRPRADRGRRARGRPSHPPRREEPAQRWFAG